MPLAEDDDMVETFPPDRADQPFRMSVLPWRAWRGWPVPNAHGAKPPGKNFAIHKVAIEEGVAALAFDYARRHHMLDGVNVLDFQLLRTIKDMTSHLEVRQCTTGEWEQAILQGFKVWRAVLAARGGRIAVDLDQRRVDYLGPAEADQARSDPSP